MDRRRRSREEEITKRGFGKRGSDWKGKRGARSGFLDAYYVSAGRKFVSRWKRARTMPGRINLSEFSESWSRSAATKRISSTRPPSGFPFLGLSFRRAFRRFSTRSGFDGSMEGRIFGGNEETMISMTGRKETCLEFIPPPPQKRPSRPWIEY